MTIKISQRVRQKLLEKHNVSPDEISQCFMNRGDGDGFLEDPREEHKTDPPTQWFIGETNQKRTLKILFMQHVTEREDAATEIHIKSAFEPNLEELRIYNKYGKS